MTHIYVGNLTIIASDNGLSLVRCKQFSEQMLECYCYYYYYYYHYYYYYYYYYLIVKHTCETIGTRTIRSRRIWVIPSLGNTIYCSVDGNPCMVYSLINGFRMKDIYNPMNYMMTAKITQTNVLGV